MADSKRIDIEMFKATNLFRSLSKRMSAVEISDDTILESDEFCQFISNDYCDPEEGHHAQEIYTVARVSEIPTIVSGIQIQNPDSRIIVIFSIGSKYCKDSSWNQELPPLVHNLITNPEKQCSPYMDLDTNTKFIVVLFLIDPQYKLSPRPDGLIKGIRAFERRKPSNITSSLEAFVIPKDINPNELIEIVDTMPKQILIYILDCTGQIASPMFNLCMNEPKYFGRVHMCQPKCDKTGEQVYNMPIITANTLYDNSTLRFAHPELDKDLIFENMGVHTYAPFHTFLIQYFAYRKVFYLQVLMKMIGFTTVTRINELNDGSSITLQGITLNTFCTLWSDEKKGFREIDTFKYAMYFNIPNIYVVISRFVLKKKNLCEPEVLNTILLRDYICKEIQSILDLFQMYGIESENKEEYPRVYEHSIKDIDVITSLFIQYNIVI